MRTAFVPALTGGVCLLILTACGTSKSVLSGDFSTLEDGGDGYTLEINYYLRHLNERVTLGSSVVENGAVELKFTFDEEVPRFAHLTISHPNRQITSGRSFILEQDTQYVVEVWDQSNLWMTITSNGTYAHLEEQEQAAELAYLELQNELRELLQESSDNEPDRYPLPIQSDANDSVEREPSVHAEVLDWENMTCVDYAGEFENFLDKARTHYSSQEVSDEVRTVRRRLQEMSDSMFEQRNQRLIELLTTSTDPVERLLALEFNVTLDFEEQLQIWEELETQLPVDVVEERVTPSLNYFRDAINRKQADESLKLGTIVPAFDILLDDNESVPFVTVLQNSQVVVLDFWQNYCSWCLEAFQEYRVFYEEFAELGFEVVSVSLEPERDDWVQKSAELDFPWVNAFAPGGRDGEVSIMFGIEYPRKNFVLDSDGCILKRDLNPNELRDFLGARLGS